MRFKRFKRTVDSGPAPGPGGPEARAVPGEELWWPPGGSAGVVVTEQTALQFAALLAAVGVLSTDTAVPPLRCMQSMPDGSRREAKEHGNHELLCRSPDGESTPLAWRRAWMAHALIYGNGYAEIQRKGNGRPYALHLMDPASTRAERGPDRTLFYRTGVAASGARTIPAANVLHISGLGFDGISGYNLVRLLRQSIGLGIAGETFAADFFSNGSESGGVIEIPGRLKDNDAAERLVNRWEGRHQGAGRRHKVALLQEGAKYTPTGTDPEKSQLLETRKFQVLDSIRPWRVPPNKVGDYSEAHLANLEQSNLDYLLTALAGWFKGVEQQCDLKLFTRAEWLAGYHVEHDTSALQRGDIKTRYDSYAAAIRDGWMSRDEVRGREGLNPMGRARGGDTFTVQMQVVPLENAGKTPPAADPKASPEPPPEAEPDAA